MSPSCHVMLLLVATAVLACMAPGAEAKTTVEQYTETEQSLIIAAFPKDSFDLTLTQLTYPKSGGNPYIVMGLNRDYDFDITTKISINGAASKKCMGMVNNRVTADCTVQAVMNTCTRTTPEDEGSEECTPDRNVRLAIKYSADVKQILAERSTMVQQSRITDLTTTPPSFSTSGYSTPSSRDDYTTSTPCTVTVYEGFEGSEVVMQLTFGSPMVVLRNMPRTRYRSKYTA